MSLRLRLISLCCGALAVSLLLAGVVAYATASRSVRTEMHAAFMVGRQTIDSAIERLRGSDDPSRDLDALVASFAGNRHLRVQLSGKKTALVAPPVEQSAFGHVPGWFVGLVAGKPQIERIPVKIGAREYGPIVIATDPHNETLEVWSEFTDGLFAPAVLYGLTILLIYVFIGRMLRPIDRLTGALEEVGDGRFRTRFDGRLPPELARLRDSFNRMAARLAATDADNRRLNEQLLSLQEQERSDLARDLHDEVGPFLFAIGVDAAAASRLLAEHRAGDAHERIRSIAEAVRHTQRQVRRMLGRLRPIGLAELGLPEAIENIVGFWRRRHPQIDFRVTVAASCADPTVAGPTISRIVQEALSNAVRHAEPRLIKISIDREPAAAGGEIRVEVADDGRGMAHATPMGYGLIGIRERVRAMGGRLSVVSHPGTGLTVRAALPCSPEADPMPSPVSEAETCRS
jgi:two-component system, NarL family, sensor histidine kinase UhpB